MSVKRIMVVFLTFLLFTSQMSFAQRRINGGRNFKPKNFSAPNGVDILLNLWDLSRHDPNLAVAVTFVLVGKQQVEEEFWRSFQDRTQDHVGLAKALGKSPTFKGKYVLGLVDAPHMPKEVLRSVEEFLLTPQSQLRGEPYQNGHRFYLPRVNAVAETDTNRKIILVRQESIRATGQPYYSYLIKPIKGEGVKKSKHANKR